MGFHTFHVVLWVDVWVEEGYLANCALLFLFMTMPILIHFIQSRDGKDVVLQWNKAEDVIVNNITFGLSQSVH
jgi:hypothetical protein